MALVVRNGRGLAKVGMVKIFPPFLPNKLKFGGYSPYEYTFADS